MCGIAGVLRFDGSPAAPELLKRMTDSIRHRGPDGEGMHVCGSVGLGHRRLAIIDLSPAGKQPLSNEDGTVWITYNGEIYNFQEIRKDLEARGHRFASMTDTEVVVHAYEEWGTECLAKFNGMFAFGLWDERKKRLWLVRDRLGVKPLFYSRQPQCLLFGSEIKAILCDSRLERRIDYEALSYYLALNYTPGPWTLFEGVRQVLPGHYLLADLAGHVQDVEYWDVVYREGEPRRTEEAWVEEFNSILEDSVRRRLVSDVPFGAFLSGGIDSSTVAYWMSRHLSQPLKSFSIGFGERTYDERGYAREAAASIGADHCEHVVTPDAAAILPKLVWHAEEPTADSSMVAVYYLARETRKYVTMVQTGDGADEILAGYETYPAYYLCRLYRVLPAWLRRRLFQPLVNAMPSSDAKVSLDFKLKRFVAGAELPPEEAHASWRMIFNGDARRQLLSPVLDRPGARADAFDLYRNTFAKTNARHPLNRMLYVDTRFYLPNDMLVKVDRMTMAHALEAREPLLDYRLVEFCASVPPRLKLKRFRCTKYLLKASMKSKLPSRVVWRKKEGFNVPKARWIRQELRPFVMDTLSDARIRDMGVLNREVVASLLRDHFAGRTDNSYQIWSLLTLCLWNDHFLKTPLSSPKELPHGSENPAA